MFHIFKNLEARITTRIIYTAALIIVLIILGIMLGGTFQGGKNLVINEVMASNRSTLVDEDGDYPDWFEIYNPGNTAISLDGYWITDDSADPYKWPFPAVEIGPQEYLVIFASNKDRRNPDGKLHANFTLSATSSTLILVDPEASVIDTVTTTDMLSNVSYGRVEENPSEWAYFLDATPGAANSEEPFEQVTDMPRLEEKPVLINEFITSNRTSLPDEDGDLSDWIEIYNPNDFPVNMERYWLSDKIDNPYKWRFPAVTIEPGEFLVIFASGKNRSNPEGIYLHTNFSLNDRDDTLILSTPEGAVIEEIEIRNMERDVSYGRDPDNPDRWLYFTRPTPGEPNYTQGFEHFSGSPVPNLIISEAMAENVTTIADEDGEYSDWIEIYNPGDFAVNLNGFGLSDSADEPYRWKFPEVTIEPGEYLLVFASGKDRADTDSAYLHTNFKIQATGETLVLYHPSGIMLDSMHTGMLSPDMSVGRSPENRSNRYFFETPAPGAVNVSSVYSGYSLPPVISHPGGFYTSGLFVDMTSPGPGSVIRYTLDGTVPDENSPVYSEPLAINDTSVLRAVSFEEGKLPSPVENRTYFIDTDHNLTVVSVIMDPKDLWDPVQGIYVKGYGASSTFPYKGANFWKDMEKPIHLELYEPEGLLGISMDAGIKIGGQYSRAMDQKIFNVFFRNIYGYNELRYPLFPEKDLTHFKALTLRTSGQDSVYSKIRDIMMTSLLGDMGLDYQAHRQAVLYLNGEYWGIYNIRERANRYMIAHNHDLDPDKIDLLQANWIVRAGSNADYLDLLNFVRN
ncbi:MAG: lamin tail domain-containing protein, partial [Bacillota bacterium]|nr:lamin tail domain-containing protein [Bacillota bacterium]